MISGAHHDRGVVFHDPQVVLVEDGDASGIAQLSDGQERGCHVVEDTAFSGIGREAGDTKVAFVSVGHRVCIGQGDGDRCSGGCSIEDRAVECTAFIAGHHVRGCSGVGHCKEWVVGCTLREKCRCTRGGDRCVCG